jgi:type I restriction enzyme R subunit
MPGNINITPDMLQLSAFRLSKSEEGSATPVIGEGDKLPPITEFGANAYTEEEEKSLSEIIEAFNERHGTNFSREDFLRFERVVRDVMDDDMTEMMKNNPADVVYGAFSQAFFQGMVRLFQTDREFQSVFMQDSKARDSATRHFFNRALRQAMNK